METKHLHARAEELLAEFQRLRSGLHDLQRQLVELNVTETSDDRLVTVTVGARGHLVRLELDPRIYRRPDATELASTITETIRRATTRAQDRVAEICRPYLPDAEVRAHLNHDFDGMFRRMDVELDAIKEGARP